MMAYATKEALYLGPEKITTTEPEPSKKVVLMMDLHMIEITW